MEEKYYALGAGRLYIAPAEVSEAAARSLRFYAGATKGGVKLQYSAKVHEIKGWDGEVVRSVRYGARVRIEGRLVRLYPRVLAAATGSPTDGSIVYLGGKTDAGRHARVRIVLVAEIPESAGGGEVVFSLIASASSGAELSLSPERDSAWKFSLIAESDDAGVMGKVVFG